jgi:hypothetical protein
MNNNTDLLFEGVSFNIAYWKSKTEKEFTEQLAVKGYFKDNPAKAKEAWRQIKEAGKVKEAAPTPANG